MKKIIIISSIVLILVAAGIGAYLYFNSFQKVTFNFKQSNVTGVVYKPGADTHEGQDDTEVQKVDGSSTITLPKGDYYLRPHGQNVTDTRISFNLGEQPITVDIDPNYTNDFLTQKLKDETAALKAALLAKYPTLIPKYSIGQGQLFEKGDWYGTTLQLASNGNEDARDLYHVILHKANATWQVVGKPELILSASAYPDVPIEVLKTTNSLAQ